MFRSPFSLLSARAVIGSRQLHASPTARKTVTEKVTEVADKVNKGVGKTLASAIEKGEKATNVAKETLESTSEEAKSKVEEAEGRLKHKANETVAKAREAKDELNK
ncbi:hypothetical protein CPB84DRAFT_1841392 [Gymnopilus junonius]|uniref:Uncharacterized protein n=1 Tax=Gymnopilus junonius TaxID=109634 RepID=A0A9P5TUJ0_GYMJU|nr:hypothetical protein CPB84DRAFT_1841392 [Gymnopilus junonius]